MIICHSHPNWQPTRIAERIAAQPDVLRVIHVKPAGDRWRYMIETPFGTFPRFVIGTTDAELQDVRPLFKCGLLATAEDEWNKT